MKGLNSNILNPYTRQFHLIQFILWATYGAIFRLSWLGYDYIPPENFWFAVYVIGGYLATTILAFLYWQLRQHSFPKQFVIATIASVILGITWRICFNYFDFHFLLDEPPKDVDAFYYVLGGTSSVIHLIAWSTGYLLISYYYMFKKERERSILAELHAKEAQIKQLHQQVSPHFLFNVLHSVDTLLIKQDIERSREMVSTLGQYLRNSLSIEPDASITLADEIKSAQSYLRIGQLRFGEKLEVQWNLDEKLDKFTVPALILQPLLENAIKHCIDKSVHGGRIEIRTERLDGRIFISVLNEAFGEPQQTKKPTGLGIGLENIKARLEIYYGTRASLHTKQEKDGEFTAIIKIGDEP